MPPLYEIYEGDERVIMHELDVSKKQREQVKKKREDNARRLDEVEKKVKDAEQSGDRSQHPPGPTDR